MARRPIERNGLILVYHRVAELGCDPFGISVSPWRFAEQLQVLRRSARVIPLRRLVRSLRSGSIPRQSVAVTFDDGYADNLEAAKPLLERFDVPATIFIATGQLDRAREFWWDELERVFLEPGRLPRILRLELAGAVRNWALGAAAEYQEDTARRWRGWKCWERAPTPRHATFFAVWKAVQLLSEKHRQDALDAIAAWSGQGLEARPSYRTLCERQLRDLAAGDLIEIGAHTVTHAALCEHPVRVQRAEIRQSRTRLEEILGRDVASFAYPYGARSEETVEIVRECGFSYACSTDPDRVVPGADHFQLPRVQIEDWDGDEFAKRLRAWFDGGREGYRQ